MLPLLAKLKTELSALKMDMERSGFSKINHFQEADAIDRIVELIDNDKIEINGTERFEIEKESGKMGVRRQEICWQSLHSIGKGGKAIAGEQSGIAKRMLQETLVTAIALKQKISEIS